MWFGSQVDQIWLADDRKATNIEVRGVVSIETDLVWKRSPSEVFFFFSEKRQGGLLKGGETDALEQQQKVFYYPFYKPPSKNIPTMMKMSDLNSTITRLWMVRAPSLFHDDFFILLWSLELKRQSGRQPCAPLQLCVSLQIRRPPAPSITRTSFPSLRSPLKPF